MCDLYTTVRRNRYVGGLTSCLPVGRFLIFIALEIMILV